MQPERRIHRILITQNTEYHLRRRQCVAVRNRNTGEWYSMHRALSLEVAGSLRFFEHGGLKLQEQLPVVGDCVYFQDTNIVTTPVIGVERPPKHIVELRYP